MEGSVFYVSSWHTWNCECSELVLTFSQTFCLKTNARSHSLQPLLNGQILLTSLFPEECNRILFPPRSCRVPAGFLANVSSSPRFPAAVPRRLPWAAGSASLPCAWGSHPQLQALETRIFGVACPGAGPRASHPLGHPCCGSLGVIGLGYPGFSSGRLCVHLSRGQLVVPAHCSLWHPALPLGGQPWTEHHSCALLPVPVEACPASPKSLGASAWGNPLFGLSGSLLWLVTPQSHGILSAEQYVLQGRAARVPHLPFPICCCPVLCRSSCFQPSSHRITFSAILILGD